MYFSLLGGASEATTVDIAGNIEGNRICGFGL
jgi:hypothetical protein